MQDLPHATAVVVFDGAGCTCKDFMGYGNCGHTLSLQSTLVSNKPSQIKAGRVALAKPKGSENGLCLTLRLPFQRLSDVKLSESATSANTGKQPPETPLTDPDNEMTQENTAPVDSIEKNILSLCSHSMDVWKQVNDLTVDVAQENV